MVPLIIRDGVPLTAAALAVTACAQLAGRTYSIFQFPSAKNFSFGVLAMSISGMIGRELAIGVSGKESFNKKSFCRFIGLSLGAAAAAAGLTQQVSLGRFSWIPVIPSRSGVFAILTAGSMTAIDHFKWFSYRQKLTQQKIPKAEENLLRSFKGQIYSSGIGLTCGDLTLEKVQFIDAFREAKRTIYMANRYGVEVSENFKDLFGTAKIYFNRMENIPFYQGDVSTFATKTQEETNDIIRRIFLGEFIFTEDQKRAWNNRLMNPLYLDPNHLLNDKVKKSCELLNPKRQGQLSHTELEEIREASEIVGEDLLERSKRFFRVEIKIFGVNQFPGFENEYKWIGPRELW
jgi:protein-S-isoprenylcysteine O-methyltransferase Ste14